MKHRAYRYPFYLYPLYLNVFVLLQVAKSVRAGSSSVSRNNTAYDSVLGNE